MYRKYEATKMQHVEAREIRRKAALQMRKSANGFEEFVKAARDEARLANEASKYFRLYVEFQLLSEPDEGDLYDI